MSTTGTYAFAPIASDLVVNAFGRCKIRRSALTVDHLRDAALQANLLQVEFASFPGVNLWTVDLVTETLTQGTATYDVDPTTLMIMSAYIEQTSSPPIDRIIISVSRDEYAAYPNKEQQAPPTVYWFDRLIAPTLTLWPVPDSSTAYTLKYYRARQIQDASIINGLQPEIPYRFLEAYTSGLAYKLAQIWAQDELPRLRVEKQEAWDMASRKDVENAPVRISPQLGSYFSGAYS